ncbi:cell division cycle-associated protein 2 isoform X2 [Calonectris borealis]|uniref:cell division cycle-associated protein 2 isoform X2 n=1 Tax=Calonectris borealis TaxID=1323832 RepID=UPI003F4C1716
MHRRSKNINAPLEVKENESRYTEAKEEASFPDLSKVQKICKVTKSKVIKASKKENLSDGNQAQLQKCSLKYTKGLERESYHHKEDVVSCQFTECFFDTLTGDMIGEPTLPLNSKENFSRGRPVPLGDECYLTPSRDKTEEKSDCGISEKQRKKPVDFATVTIAEFGITQESFTKRSIGKSPTSLKFRRRSAIGVRGSPEHNTLIRYLAQQRSNRQKESFTQVSAFKHENVRSLKDKIDAFQTSFKSVQEAEGETGFSGLSQVDDASQEAGSSQNKVPFTKEWNLNQRSEKFMSDNSGADLKENLRQNLTNSSKSDTKISTILSSHQDVTITEPAAAVSQEWAYEQHNPIESEAVLMRDILEAGHDFSSDHITKDVRGNVISDLSRKKVGFVEEQSLEIFDESKPPITPLQTGNISLNEHTQSGSHLRSVLKKTPIKQLMDSMKEYSNDAVDRGGGESFTVSNCAKIFEALQTEKTERHSSEKPKKKRVTFGEVLSPEIFDETLPANTPLRKGATPVRHPGLQSNSPFARFSLIEEPLSQPNFDCSDECIESLQELAEGSVAAEDLLPVENAEAETDKSNMITTRSSTKRKCSTVSEGTDFSISRATNTKNAKDTRNPRKNKFQKQKNITTSAAKKTQKIKHTSYGKRRKKKVKKSLYGEREMASKKPLLSPIPEIPEAFSSASSPNSPKANAFFSEDIFLDNTKSRNARKDVQQKLVAEGMRAKNIRAVHTYSSPKGLDIAEASSSNDTVFQGSDGGLKSLSGIDLKFSNIMPDAKCVFDTSDYFQRDKETACVKEAKESDSSIKTKKLQGNLLNKAEQQTRLEFLEQQDTSVHEGAQRTQCPQKDSVRGSPSRRRRRISAICFPPVEKLEITGNNLPVSSFNVEEVLSAPQLKNDSLEPFRRKSDNSGEKRVRRSMRLHKDAEIEGLAWIEVPNEIQKNPHLLASACKIRRTIITSIFTESENIHHREQNLIQFSAPGKENNDSVHLAGGSSKRWRRKSMCVSTPQETRTWSQTRKRSITNSVYRKDRTSQKHSEEVEIPLENSSNI